MSVLELRILLYIHSIPIYDAEMASKAGKEALRYLYTQGLISMSHPELVQDTGNITTDHGIKVTSRGQAHIRQLLDTPFPEMAWLNSQGERIPA